MNNIIIYLTDSSILINVLIFKIYQQMKILIQMVPQLFPYLHDQAETINPAEISITAFFLTAPTSPFALTKVFTGLNY